MSGLLERGTTYQEATARIFKALAPQMAYTELVPRLCNVSKIVHVLGPAFGVLAILGRVPYTPDLQIENCMKRQHLEFSKE